ncbi:hypothetical protein GGR34_003494 [Microvirga flocculans]|uniref:Uncharacterized protein n=1 Tax=Microvirga flocculans TaxID=217168 RepID=A0A7W6II02_9HYPH|nr:hypothetical protein [Microvirga flocculans]MBB4041813.1 hypothetical protein [Microvirga flocculans]
MNTVIEAANSLAVQRILRRYLSPERGNEVRTVEGACITSRRTWSRYGVPADATCWRVIIEHPELGWSVTARAVWRDGRLMEPVATHTTIEKYWADNTQLIDDEDAACLAFNDWAQSVPV